MLKEELDRTVLDTSAPKSQIEDLVLDKMAKFIQMIETNDV